VIDAVLSYHMNPQTCGVAKFNVELAQRLGVPMWQYDSVDGSFAKHPLISAKPSECNHWPQHFRHFDLFLHGVPTSDTMLQRPLRVYAGNPEIAEAVRKVRPDVIEAFCPSTITGNPHRGAYRVLVFGMAHKLLVPHFERLKTQLDAEHPDYTIELSTAVHEGSPWHEALADSVFAMRRIFGDKLRVLGFLGDDALARVLEEVDAVACLYQPALRANNTTAWAALEAGKTLYTNTDEMSPPLDAKAHSWDRLVEMIRA